MINKKDSNISRKKRHARVRAKISGTTEIPRLNVFRSTNHIYAQIIDDTTGTTLVSASTLEKGFDASGTKKESAKKVGLVLAERASKKAISNVKFDRGGYIYHGRVQELAEGAREGGLKF